MAGKNSRDKRVHGSAPEAPESEHWRDWRLQQSTNRGRDYKMTDRERAEAAQNHDINDDDCRKHNEPLYSGWCKACAGQAITDAVSLWREAALEAARVFQGEAPATAAKFWELMQALGVDSQQLPRRDWPDTSQMPEQNRMLGY